MDKLKAMKVFVRVAECGNFSRAAESLNLANATVTASVRHLEEDLNVALIRRDTRRLMLTGEGERVLLRAREILQSMAQMEDEFRTQSLAPSGTLHIEVPISFGQTLLSPVLPLFAKRYPEVMTTVTLTNEPHNLIARAIDVAVRFDHVESEEFVARPLFETPYVVCGTSEVVAFLPADPAELDPRLCISMLYQETRHPMPWIFTNGDRKVMLEPRGPLHYNNADAAIVAVKSGIGVACIADIYATPHLEAGTVVRAYPQWSMRKRTGYLVSTRERANSATVRAFSQFLLEVLDPTLRPSIHGVVPIKTTRGRKSS